MTKKLTKNMLKNYFDDFVKKKDFEDFPKWIKLIFTSLSIWLKNWR